MQRMRFAVFLTLVISGCASTTPKPVDQLGVGEHEKAASAAQREASEHRRLAEEYVAPPCPSNAPCWSALSNPKAAMEREQAERQQRYAAEHRARAEKLREAEKRYCAGVSEYDRSVSPFFHIHDIRGVEPVTTPTGALSGIVVSFKNIRGMTLDRIQSIVNCHIARDTALGHDVPEMADCPLVPRVHAIVFRGDEGIVVRIMADDDAAAKQLERCSTLIKAAMPPSI